MLSPALHRPGAPAPAEPSGPVAVSILEPVRGRRSSADMENERRIIDAVRGGDRDAYAELVRTYHDRVFRTCRSLLLSNAEADDAAQDAFVKAYESLGSFRSESSFGTWIFRIAHNHCMDLLRSRTQRKTDSLDALLEANGERSDLSGTVDRGSEPDENAALARDVLAAVRPEYREILTLREVTGLTYTEIARTLHCSLDAVKARLQRARHELQERARHFLDPTTVQQAKGDVR